MPSIDRQSFRVRSLLAGLIVSLLALLAMASRQALAGPVTPSAPVKAAVYSGVLSIVPSSMLPTTGGATAVNDTLEFGYRGTNIDSLGNIYLRPGGLDEQHSVSVFSDNIYTHVDIPGSLCLGVCQNAWPSGSSNWTVSNNRLQPVTSSNGIFVAPPNTHAAVQVYGNDADAALYIKNTSASGLGLAVAGGPNFIYGDVRVNPAAPLALTISYYRATYGDYKTFPVWSAANDGNGSGLDADIFDGVDLDYIVFSGQDRICRTAGGGCLNIQ